ncbi:MAG: DolP-mannose mannosyltransferase, partial [Halobacteriaceae archaeon]
RWRSLIVGQTTLLLLFVVSPNFLLPGRARLGADETLFAYSGWLWAETAKVPYLHLWDVKPPAIHETAALFSLLSGGNPWGIALLSALFMCLLIIGSNVLIGQLVYYHTSNPIAAYIAGTTPLVYPTYYNLAATGLRPKHFTIFFGLLGMYLYLVKDRWALGGFSVAIAAGYWQFGVIFPIIAVVTSYTAGKSELKAVVGGGFGATLLVVAPVYISSPAAFSSMLVEVIGTSVRVTEPLELGVRLRKFLRFLSFALPVIGLGLFGAVLAGIKRETAWITAGAGWFFLQVFRFDLDSTPDLLLLVIFAALGLGILIEVVDEESIPLYLVLGVVATGFVISLITVATPLNSAPPPESLDALFWEQQITEQCHLRMSGTEE